LTKRMIYQTVDTKEKILSAAEQLILEKGLFELQMKDLAVKAGISRNSLYRYFRDKAHLAFTLMKLKLEKIIFHKQDIQGELEGANCLDKIKDYYIKVWMNPDFHRDYLFLAEFDAYYSGARQLREPMEDEEGICYNEQWDNLYQLLKQGQQEGSIRIDRDAHLLSVTLLNGFRSLQQRLLLRSESLLEIRQGEQ
jgi:AcrR family transcriptional regulator